MKGCKLYLICLGIMIATMGPQLARAQSMEMTSAKVYIQQKDWDKAIDFLEKAIQKKPENAEAHFLLGQGYGQKARYTEMVEQFNAAEQYDKKNKYTKEIANFRQHFFAESFNSGVAAFNQQNFDEAAERFGIAKLIDPKSVAAYQNLAIGYRQMERDARDSTCADCPAGSYQWSTARMRCLDASGTPAKSCCCPEAAQHLSQAVVNTYESLISLEPDSISHYFAFSDYYKGKEEFDKSAALLESAAQKHPGDARLLAELAISYDMLGKKDEAFKTYEQALANKPDDKDLRFNYGRLFLLREDYNGAIQQFQMVLQTNPDDFESNYNVGVSHLKLGESADKQLRELEETAATNKKKMDTALADSLRTEMTKHFQAAVPYLEKASQINPDQSAVWYNLAVGYTRTGSEEKAKEAFDKAEQLEN